MYVHVYIYIYIYMCVCIDSFIYSVCTILGSGRPFFLNIYIYIYVCVRACRWEERGRDGVVWFACLVSMS